MIVRLEDLRLASEPEDERSPDGGDVQRLVVLVENEHRSMAIEGHQRPVGRSVERNMTVVALERIGIEHGRTAYRFLAESGEQPLPDGSPDRMQ